MANRRGKSASCVDTKFTNAWLGFYVALTKNEAFLGSDATTEVATETSFSEAASSHLSPRQVADDSEVEEIEAVAAHSDGESVDDDDSTEQSPAKRTRRSRRRRRTRGRGRRNAARQSEAALGNIDEQLLPENGAPDTCSVSIMSAAPSTTASAGQARSSAVIASPTSSASLHGASPQWPFQAPRAHESCPRAFLRTEPLPVSPSKAQTGAMGIVSTRPETSLSPTYREASARTPPRAHVTICNSSVAQLIPVAPVDFSPSASPALCLGEKPRAGEHLGYETAHTLLGSFMLSPCRNFTTSAPTGFLQVPAAPPMCPPNVAVGCVEISEADAWRSWLCGGLPLSGEALAQHLWAAALVAYED